MKLEHICREPESQARETPLLFVHGAWHGAWCWDEGFLQYFADQGYAAHAISLRGHGSSEGRERLRWTRLSEYVDDVARTVDELPAPPILIGHSMGGAVVQKYLEQHDLPGAVLMASMPPSGVLATVLRIAVRHPLRLLKMNLTLSLLPVVDTPEMVREMFYSDRLTDELLQQFTAMLQDESYMAFLDMLVLNLPRPDQVDSPLLVVGGGLDRTFVPSQVIATARAYAAEAVLFPEAAHNLMLEPDWATVAHCILKWIAELKP